MKKNHNGIISFWKFMFSLMIMALHSGSYYPELKYHFSSGSLGVEFFFIVSGYLFCKKCLKYKNVNNEDLGKESFLFLIKKIKSFLPYIIFLIVISIPCTLFFLRFNIADYVHSLYNILLLPVEGGVHQDVYALLWYISTMIIVQFFLFPIIIKKRNNYVYYVSPILVFILSGYLLVKWGFIADPWSLELLSYKGVIRGLLDINIGIAIYPLVEKIKKTNLTDFSRLILTIFEFVGYLSIFIIVNKSIAHIRYTMLCLLIMSSCITISFSNKSLMQDFSNNKLFYYLEKISLPLYINQWLIIYMIRYVTDSFNYNIAYRYLFLITFVISIIIGVVELKIIKVFSNNKSKIKKIFISD